MELEPSADKTAGLPEGITVHRILRRLQTLPQIQRADMQQLARELGAPPGADAEVAVVQLLAGGVAALGAAREEGRCPVEGCEVRGLVAVKMTGAEEGP